MQLYRINILLFLDVSTHNFVLSIIDNTYGNKNYWKQNYGLQEET